MDDVSLVKNKTDIVELIRSYVPLKKTGANFKGNCPFHKETTPSFVVSPERQIWHCFGCGKGGDAFSFLMEYEKMEFPEALRFLAQRAGVALSGKTIQSDFSSKKELFYTLNKLAAEYYHFVLTKHPVGKAALSYLLETRKLNPQIIETYQLGFAPSSGNALIAYLIQKKKYKAQDLLEAGLITKRYNGFADFFQGRLVFPLYDHRGNVIGFSGRAISENYSGGKYINTRETPIYHKGSVFFGLNSSKNAIKKDEAAIIMEGEFDVIAAFQEGIENTVAIKGTALTDDQARLLSRFAKRVILCLDNDSAGKDAMKRSLPILEAHNFITEIVENATGKDPDEALKENPVEFKKALKHAKSAYEVILSWLLSAHNPSRVEEKRIIGDEFLLLLSHVENEIVKEHYVRELSRTLDVPEETLMREMERIVKAASVRLGGGYQTVAPQEDLHTKKSREELLENYLVSLLVQSSKPKEYIKQAQQGLSDYSWHTPAFEKIIVYFIKAMKNLDNPMVSNVLAALPVELAQAFDVCFVRPLPDFANEEIYSKEIAKTIQKMQALNFKKQINEITKSLQQAEKEGQEQSVLLFQEQLAKLVEKLNTISKG